MLKGGNPIDDQVISEFIEIYKSVPDISSDNSIQEYKKKIDDSFSKIFGARLDLTNKQKKMLSEQLGIDVNTPNVSFNTNAGTTFANKQIEAAVNLNSKYSVASHSYASAQKNKQGGAAENPQAGAKDAVSQKGGGASSASVASASPPLTSNKLSDITLDGDIGYTKSADGTFKSTGARTPDIGAKQKAFIIKKSEQIKDALTDVAIKERVKGQNQGAITNYNTAMEAAKGYLEDGFTPIAIQGGKRSRRRRSNTRNRRTKNNHKKLYKR